jgi:hypothetical protein
MAASCPMHARLFVIDIPTNSYAAGPADETVQVYNTPLEEDCFVFAEYHLLSMLAPD